MLLTINVKNMKFTYNKIIQQIMLLKTPQQIILLGQQGLE